MFIQGLNWYVFSLNVNMWQFINIISNVIFLFIQMIKIWSFWSAISKNCNKVFKLKCLLNSHKLIDSNEKKFNCDWNQCHMKFKHKSVWNQHKNYMHLKLKKFECNWTVHRKTGPSNFYAYADNWFWAPVLSTLCILMLRMWCAVKNLILKIKDLFYGPVLRCTVQLWRMSSTIQKKRGLKNS